ncbi:MAG: hypothetical protein JST00_12870 [Deltaproteobacteria bacterium]|nr:hypothetical protein [Deltaproteobacteria bacterium]
MDVTRAAAVAVAVMAFAGPARAESSTPADARAPAPKPSATPATNAASASQRPATEPMVGVADEALSRIIDRPHTIAEIELGIVALPTAPISAGQSGGDTPFGTIGRGDATMQTGLHVLYRFHRNFAVGAGALFSPFPTSDPEYGGLRQLPRTHSRGYFFFGGEGRWVPLHWKFFEGWLGVSIGGVVVADRFNTDAGDRVAPILGTKEVTIRTEGFAAGLQMGGTYYITENWIAGTMFRAYRWILPDTPRCSSIGDCGTLSGSITALEFGITIGYRLPL